MEAHTEAVWAAYNAAELKASDVRENCGPAPIDHAAQAALEHSDIRGDAFNAAYAEVFQTINTLVEKYDTNTAAKKFRRLRLELL
jgi:hypothetical protein